jgi:hypothetical protein
MNKILIVGNASIGLSTCMSHLLLLEMQHEMVIIQQEMAPQDLEDIIMKFESPRMCVFDDIEIPLSSSYRDFYYERPDTRTYKHLLNERYINKLNKQPYLESDIQLRTRSDC